MTLTTKIALRYLFSKKTHNAVNIISYVSVFGIIIAVAALVCTLSTYNGFRVYFENLYCNFDPQIKIVPIKGKTYIPQGKVFEEIRQDPRVKAYSEVLEDNALAKYKDAQVAVRIKGVDTSFIKLTNIENIMFKGKFKYLKEGIPYAIIGAGLANSLQVGYSFIRPITILVPKRKGKVNLVFPQNSFIQKDILISGKFGINQAEYDNKYVIVPLSFAREIFQYKDEVSAIEINLKKGIDSKQFENQIQKKLGKDYNVLDFMEQKADFYKINKIEKWITYLLLTFILLITLFNVVGSLSMLIVEKKEDLRILEQLGLDAKHIKLIFFKEGYMISIIGTFFGAILGSILILLQQHFGFIKLGGTGNYIIKAYPVILEIKDVILIIFTSLIISLPITFLPIRTYFKNRKFFTTILLLITITFPCFSQISHGGKPLPFGIEKKSLLRSSSDIFVNMPAFNVDSVMKSNSSLSKENHETLIFAHKIFCNIKPENAGEVFTINNTRIYRVGIRSRGAKSINLLFHNLDIPLGANLFLYNPQRTKILGSFTHENNPKGKDFSTSPIPGDEVIVEYSEPIDSEYTGNINISEVNHDYLGILRETPYYHKDNLTFPCIPPVSCEPKYNTIKNSICLLIINGTTLGSGVLINNTREDNTTYILSSAHCFRNNQYNKALKENGTKVVAFFNYQSPRCGKEIIGTTEQSITESELVAIDQKIDFALLKFDKKIPEYYNPYFLGWSLDSIGENQPYICISHPNADLKKYAHTNSNITKESYTFDPADIIESNNHWNVKKWDIGHTWGGSSGAPLLDKNFRIVGCLSGGDSGGLNNGCETNYVNGDFFYKLYKAWDNSPSDSSQLKHWLNPDGQDIEELDGFNPYPFSNYKTLSNITLNDSIEITYLDSPENGPMFGTNSKKSTIFAEHFENSDSILLRGLYLYIAKGNNYTKDCFLHIYQGGDKPGKEIYKTQINCLVTEYNTNNQSFEDNEKDNLDNTQSFINIDTTIYLTKDFYIAYSIPEELISKKDSFFIYNTTKSEGSALTYCNNYWEKINNKDLWIEPLVYSLGETTDTTSITRKKAVLIYQSGDMLNIISKYDYMSKVEVYNFTGTLVKNIKSHSKYINLSLNQKSSYIIRITINNEIKTYKIAYK